VREQVTGDRTRPPVSLPGSAAGHPAVRSAKDRAVVGLQPVEQPTARRLSDLRARCSVGARQGPPPPREESAGRPDERARARRPPGAEGHPRPRMGGASPLYALGMLGALRRYGRRVDAGWAGSPSGPSAAQVEDGLDRACPHRDVGRRRCSGVPPLSSPTSRPPGVRGRPLAVRAAGWITVQARTRAPGQD